MPLSQAIVFKAKRIGIFFTKRLVSNDKSSKEALRSLPVPRKIGLMSRSNLFAILGIVLCGFIAWYYQAQTNKENLELKTAIQRESSPAASSNGGTGGISSRSPDSKGSEVSTASRDEIQNELQDVTNRLNETRAAMDEKRQRLEALMSQRSEEAPVSENAEEVENVDQDTELDVAQIQQLNDRLNDLNAEESSLMATGDSVGVEGTQATMAARDQIDNQIRVLDDAIKETELQIQEWQNNNSYINERQENLSRLQSQLDSQNQQLEELRNQRGNLFNETLQNTQAEQLAKEQRLAEIITTKQSLYQEIERLRAQVSQRQSSTYVNPLTRLEQEDEDEFMILRESYEEDRRDYQNLEEEKKKLESELLAL